VSRLDKVVNQPYVDGSLELRRRVDRLTIVESGDHDGGIEGVGDTVSRNSLVA
jgi:hypothetical protein